MRRLNKGSFIDDLVYKMGQGNLEKMTYIYNCLRYIPFMDCDRIETEGECGFFGDAFVDGEGLIPIIGLVHRDQETVIHEAIHAQDKGDSALVEGSTAVSTFRLANNDEIQIKDYKMLGYSKVALLVNQIEKIYGINSLSTIGTDKSMKEFFSDFFRLYKSPLLGIYIDYCAGRIIRMEEKLPQNPQAENIANASTEIVLRVQNLLLKMFINQELKQLKNVDDAKRMLEKMQSIGETRITGEKFESHRIGNSNHYDFSREFLQENDSFFEDNYRKVYLSAVKKFGEDELKPYSYESYKDWKDNSVLLFNLDLGERQVFKYNGQYILRTSIKEDGRIVGKQSEEISANRFQELEEEYLLTRYINSMSKIADAQYYFSSTDSLALKSGKHFLYKGANYDFNQDVNIHAQKPKLVDREEAIQIIDAYFSKLSKEMKYSFLKKAINRLIGEDWNSIEFKDSLYLIEQEMTEQDTQSKKYYICGFDDGLKYDAKPVMEEVSLEKANQILTEYYDKHPIERFNRYAKLNKTYDNGISIYDFEEKHFLKREKWVFLDEMDYPSIRTLDNVTGIIELTPQENKEISECSEEIDKKLMMLKIMMRESLKNPPDFATKENKTATNAGWIEGAKLVASSTDFDVYDFYNTFLYVGKCGEKDNISAITYAISKDMVDEILDKNSNKRGKAGIDDGEQEPT